MSDTKGDDFNPAVARHILRSLANTLANDAGYIQRQLRLNEPTSLEDMYSLVACLDIFDRSWEKLRAMANGEDANGWENLLLMLTDQEG